MNQRLATLLRISFVILDLLVLNLVFIICQYVFRDAIILNKEQYTYLWFFSNARGWQQAGPPAFTRIHIFILLKNFPGER
jgi:hypothetical protein